MRPIVAVHPVMTNRPYWKYRKLVLIGLAIVVAVVGTWFGIVLRSAGKQRAAATAIRESGGAVFYDYQLGEWHSIIMVDAQPRVPKWLRYLLGDDFFCNVVVADITNDRPIGFVGDLPHLQVLRLRGRDVTDLGLRHIVACHNVRKLTVNAAVTDKAMKYVGLLTELRELNLDACPITDVGLEGLYGLTKLESLELRGTKVSDSEVRTLKQALPNCRVYLGGAGPHWE